VTAQVLVHAAVATSATTVHWAWVTLAAVEAVRWTVTVTALTSEMTALKATRWAGRPLTHDHLPCPAQTSLMGWMAAALQHGWMSAQAAKTTKTTDDRASVVQWQGLCCGWTAVSLAVGTTTDVTARRMQQAEATQRCSYRRHSLLR
jgi:hypothetical protein